MEVQSLHVAGREYGITEYAARRMAMRTISRRELRAVLARPSAVSPSRRDPSRMRWHRTVGGRRLVVVVEVYAELGPWEVVTAWEEGHHE